MSNRILQISLFHINIIIGCIHNCISEVANIKVKCPMKKFTFYVSDHGTNAYLQLLGLHIYYTCNQGICLNILMLTENVYTRKSKDEIHFFI